MPNKRSVGAPCERRSSGQSRTPSGMTERPTTMKRRRRTCVTIAAVVLLPAIARPQSPATHDASPMARASTAPCLTAESWDGAYDFMSQWLTTTDVTTVRAGELISLNHRIAGAVRATLGVSDTLLPRADTLDYPEDDGVLPITIVLHRDAPATWRVDSAADSADARFVRLYDLVLSSMAPNALRIAWPTDATRDTAEIRVRVRKQVFGGLADHPAQPAVLIYKALHPIDPNGLPVLARSGDFIPSYHVLNGVAWRVVMEATIDPNGNVEKKTVHDIPSMASASDSAHFDYAYKKLVDAARQAMLHSRYVPAHRNGCATAHLVQQSFYVNPGALR